MTTIAPFLKGHAPFFDLETTRAMSLAFDEVCRTLNIPASASAARETLAGRVIAAAHRGERNADKICNHVLRELSGGTGL